MVKLFNRTKVETATTGTGDITLGAASTGFSDEIDAGFSDGDTVRYVIEDEAEWEIGTATYSASTRTIQRSVEESSNAGSAISLSGSAYVYFPATKDSVAVRSDFLNDGYAFVKSSATAPVSPVYGQLWADTASGKIKHWDGQVWVNMSELPSEVSGGTETEYTESSIDYRSHKFATSGALTVSFSPIVVDFILVAGGGSGGRGDEAGGGGGAGGVIVEQNVVLSPGSYSVVIGAGGADRGNQKQGGSGSNSTFFGRTAIGGGGGGADADEEFSGAGGDGGSGGGGGSYDSAESASPAGAGTSGQGNDGGRPTFANTDSAAGGGGAGAVGQDSNDSRGGDGGNGIANTYEDGTSRYYGGGGGGGWRNTPSGSGDGGLGGGGDAADNVNTNGQPGSANTGGGGGGNVSSSDSGDGGSGVFIVRYMR